MKHTSFLIIFLTAFQLLVAQGGRLGQSDIELQQLFIEANQQKILGNLEKSAKLFESLLEKDKNNDAAAYELARVYEQMDKNEKAVKNAQLAVSKEGTNVWYKIFLADLYQKTNQDDKSADVYETLVEQVPDNDYYYFKWAYFLVRSNQPEKAVKVYEDLEKRIGINEELTRRKHTLYLGMGNYKKAAKELDELIAAFPRNINYRHLLASFYEQIGDKAKAKEAFVEILKLNPEDARANIALAEGGKGDSDIRYLRSLKPVFENPNVHIDVKISELLPYLTKVVETGDVPLADAAIELTDILEKVHANQAKSFSAAGDLYFHSGRKTEAIEKYKATLELNENVYLVWEQLLYAYADMSDYENLVKTSDEALDLFPNQASVFYLNGLGCYRLNKHRDAISSLQQALLMSGRNMPLKYDIQVLLGKSYFAINQFPKSDKSFEEALKINPNDAKGLNAYSYCLASRGEQLPKAKEMAALANELSPKNARYQHTYGWVLYKMKEYKNSKEWIGKALKNGGDHDKAILEHYGDVLFQLGEEENAVNYWQLALEKGGKSELLEKKISDRKLYE